MMTSQTPSPGDGGQRRPAASPSKRHTVTQAAGDDSWIIIRARAEALATAPAAAADA